MFEYWNLVFNIGAFYHCFGNKDYWCGGRDGEDQWGFKLK